jgi:hypothetical protein
MKKLLLAAVVLGVGGYFAYAKVLRPAPKRACDRMAELCEDSGGKHVDDKSCTDFFDALKKNDEADAAKIAQCVLDAKSCGEAVGCEAGGALKLGTNAAKSFLDGFQKSIK